MGSSARLTSFAFVLLALLGVGCGDDDVGGVPDAGADATPPPPPPPVEDGGELDAAPDEGPPDARAPDAGPSPVELEFAWERCAFPTGAPNADALCATVMVPSRWEDPEGPRQPVFLKRYARRTEEPIVGQIWMLAGGPAQSGAAWEGYASIIDNVAPGYEMVLVDHRGTGRSVRLGCSQEDEDSEGGFAITAAEQEACDLEVGAMLDDPAAFSTTEAARDIGELIARVRVEGAPVVVWGLSYGTYWGQRYLQLFPDQASAVVFIGIFRGDVPFASWDAATAAGQRIAQLCGDDMFCKGKLGNDPWERFGAVLDSIDEGHCPEAVEAFVGGREGIASGSILLLDREETLPFWLAAVYRLERCDPDDVAALRQLAAVLSPPPRPSALARLDSGMLFRLIVASELQRDPLPSDAEIASAHDAAFLHGTEALSPSLPLYEPDALVGAPIVTDVPVLLAHGLFDARTPVGDARALAAMLDGPNQHLVEIAYGPHAALEAPAIAGGSTCGRRIARDFLADPTAELDTSCAGDGAIDFQGDRAFSRALFGVFDAWENPTPTSRERRTGRARVTGAPTIEEARVFLRSSGVIPWPGR